MNHTVKILLSKNIVVTLAAVLLVSVLKASEHDGKGIAVATSPRALSVGVGLSRLFNRLVTAKPRSMHATEQVHPLLDQIEEPHATMRTSLALKIVDCSTTLERLRVIDPVVHDIKRVDSVPGPSPLEASSSSPAPFIRPLPQKTWMDSMAIKHKKIAQLEEEERIKAQEAERKQEVAKREREMAELKRKAQQEKEAEIARQTAIRDAQIAQRKEQKLQKRKRQLQSIRERLLHALDEIELAEDHYINTVRKGTEQIANQYLPILINDPLLKISVITDDALKKLYTYLPGIDDPEPVTDREMRFAIAPNLAIVYEYFHTITTPQKH